MKQITGGPSGPPAVSVSRTSESQMLITVYLITLELSNEAPAILMKEMTHMEHVGPVARYQEGYCVADLRFVTGCCLAVQVYRMGIGLPS